MGWGGGAFLATLSHSSTDSSECLTGCVIGGRVHRPADNPRYNDPVQFLPPPLIFTTARPTDADWLHRNWETPAHSSSSGPGRKVPKWAGNPRPAPPCPGKCRHCRRSGPARGSCCLPPAGHRVCWCSRRWVAWRARRGPGG